MCSIHTCTADLYGYSILFAVPMLLLTFRIPRSKRWLLMKGYREEARESMQFVYKGNVEVEFEKMADTMNSLCCSRGRKGSGNDLDDDSNSVGESVGNSSNKGRGDGENDDDSSNSAPAGIWAKQYRNIMGIGMGLLISQQLSGQPCVLAYSRVLFEAAGWGGNTSVVTVTIMGVVSSFTVTQVDRLGRKTLLMAGSSIMLFAVSLLAYGFWGWDDDSNDKLSSAKKQIVLWGMFIFISGYQIGFGPISWTVLSEIYPTEIRGSAMALSVEVNFFAKFLTQFMFPVIQDKLGWGTTFVVFALTIALGLIFVYFKVPETKGMTLEEIQLHLKSPEKTNLNSSIVEGYTTSASPEEFQYANMESVSKDGTTSCNSSSLRVRRSNSSLDHHLTPIV